MKNIIFGLSMGPKISLKTVYAMFKVGKSPKEKNKFASLILDMEKSHESAKNRLEQPVKKVPTKKETEKRIIKHQKEMFIYQNSIKETLETGFEGLPKKKKLPLY
jgi:poly-D-alanine transfer protein DltD